MQQQSQDDISLAIEKMTDVKIDLGDEGIKGRNVWGRAAFMQGGHGPCRDHAGG